jgi:hypothetical protein
MKEFYLSTALLTGMILAGTMPAAAGAINVSGATIGPSIIVKAGDRLSFPKRDPSRPALPKMTEEGVSNALNDQLRAKFDAAAGANHLLTAEQANNAGWGFIADHFSEIDRSKSGFVSFSEVSRYMSARSPLKSKASNPAELQIIE